MPVVRPVFQRRASAAYVEAVRLWSSTRLIQLAAAVGSGALPDHLVVASLQVAEQMGWVMGTWERLLARNAAQGRHLTELVGLTEETMDRLAETYREVMQRTGIPQSVRLRRGNDPDHPGSAPVDHGPPPRRPRRGR